MGTDRRIPSGTVTFLFTDVVGSTGLWAADREAMAASLEVHDEVLRSVFAATGGYVFTTAGDSFAVAYDRASDAVAAARDAQDRLARATWPGPALHVRMGLHQGEVVERGGDYFGPEVNLTARLEAAGHGGQILATERVASDARAEAAFLGNFRLRDVPEPVRVFQLDSGEHPPLRVASRGQTNLPESTSRLVGRDDELRAVRAALGSHRLVTLTAGGGMGKTRLAMATAESELPRWPAGVWFVDLLAVAERSQVGAAVAAAVGLELSDGDVTAQVVDYLSAQEALIVLDNCEHLVEECADFAAALLARPGTSKLLATSREFLDVDGEQVIRLGPLDLDSESGAAVQLFVERAAAIGTELDLPRNRTTMLELCRHLDGVPLAIELAAARSNVLSPTELVAGISERFELLSGGRRRRTRRTLEGMLTWSYELLDADEQRLFRHLGTFVGSFDLPAVSATSAITAAEARDLLESLVAKSLVVAAHERGRSRFRLLETTAAYAHRLLSEAGEVGEARDRHLDHHLERFSAFDVGILPDVRASHHTADRPDVAAAVEWATARDRWSDAARLVFTASVVLRSRPDEYRSMLGRCRSRTEPGDRRLDLALAILEFDTAVQLDDFRSAARTIATLGESSTPGARSCSRTLGAFMHAVTAPDVASALCDEADETLSEVPDDDIRSQLAATGLTVRAWALGLAGLHQDADDALRRAEALFAATTSLSDAELQARLTRVAITAILNDHDTALGLADTFEFPSTYFGENDGRAVALLAAGRNRDAAPIVRAHAEDAVTGRLSRRANDSFLLLAWLALNEGDLASARRYVLEVGWARSPITIMLGVHLAHRLGVGDEYQLGRADLGRAAALGVLQRLRDELPMIDWIDQRAAASRLSLSDDD